MALAQTWLGGNGRTEASGMMNYLTQLLMEYKWTVTLGQRLHVRLLRDGQGRAKSSLRSNRSTIYASLCKAQTVSCLYDGSRNADVSMKSRCSWALPEGGPMPTILHHTASVADQMPSMQPQKAVWHQSCRLWSILLCPHQKQQVKIADPLTCIMQVLSSWWFFITSAGRSSWRSSRRYWQILTSGSPKFVLTILIDWILISL